ncbi:hypothetical protein, conserved [Plasmodium ovale wallikeri]|uniref:CLASP N-terminal domain-containing protein n=2 Tax=Plasmodium ovale TaxID=36330 RepID=A0A1A8ZGT6_PLAOA|nr:hypothetical protein, conserved [Plasmodium ovale wallikeri]SBT43525.1 hypothetical protein, conserved [Plasmodium ovale wallikeri]SBT78444.1 conserved Plasmodium protein, unknown function [Plasmodium ovale]
MPTIGQSKYRDSTNTFLDDTRNFKRKSIDEQDDYSIVEDILYLNKDKKHIQNVQNENLIVNVELGSTRTSAIGINLEKSSNLMENRTSEQKNVKNYQMFNDNKEPILESPLNEIQKYQLTLLKKSNPSYPKPSKVLGTSSNMVEGNEHAMHHEDSESRHKNDKTSIDIYLKENINELNDFKELKMQERHLLIKPRRNYHHLNPTHRDDVALIDQKNCSSKKNMNTENGGTLKCGNFMNNSKIKGYIETKRDANDANNASDSNDANNASDVSVGSDVNEDTTYGRNNGHRNCHNQQKALNYHDKIQNERYNDACVRNNLTSKGEMGKWDEETVLYNNRNAPINQRYQKLSETSESRVDFKKENLMYKDSVHEKCAIQKKHISTCGKKNIIDSNQYDNEEKSILYDHLNKNTIHEISKNAYKMSDNCVIYQRDMYNKNRVMEATNNKEDSNSNHYRKNENIHLSSGTSANFFTVHNDVDEVAMNRVSNAKSEIKNMANNESSSMNINISTANRKNVPYEKSIIDVSTHADVKAHIKILNKNKPPISNVKAQDKNSHSDKPLNSILHSNTPNKSVNMHINKNVNVNITKNSKNMNVSSKIKNDKAVTYLTYEDIADFGFEVNNDNINDMITKLIEIKKDQEWTKQIENLINLRTILKYHHIIFFENYTKDLRKISRSIIELLNSPRSCVSKNALLCLSEFYSIGKKKMDSTLDDVIMPCLKKAYQTSIDFLSSAANNALLSICNSCSESKLILHFVKIITSKPKTYNLICLKCVIAVIIKFEENISKFKEINKLIEALLECTAVGSAEIKCTARVALVVLDNICPIKQIGSKLHIPAEKIKKIEHLIDRTSESEIDAVLGKIKFS